VTPEDLLRGMTPPAPSAFLRRCILSRAKEVSPEPDPSLVDRIWGSRPLRLAWASLVAVLLLGHAALSPAAPPAAPRLRGRFVAPATDLGFDEALLPKLLARRALRSGPRDRHPRLIDVWLDPTLAVWM
jgi:hypothetical protein